MKRILCLVAVFGLWMLLFWSADPWVIGTGVFFGLVVATVVGEIYPEGLTRVLNPLRWVYFLVYLPYFFWYVLWANMDVALRVIHPDVPIRPGIVKVHTSLRTEMGKTFLANSITLTPGTLTVDIDGEDLYVHCIQVDPGDVKKRTAAICGRFEPLLRRIFE